MLIGCAHAFCQDCISTYVRGKVAAGDVLSESLACPCVDPRCATPLVPQDVLRCLDPEQGERYERLALQRCVEAEDGLGQCPTAGCPFMFAWEASNRKLGCPMCNKSFCLVCRCEPWHRGKRCEQYQAERGDPDASDAAFEHFARAQRLRQCPKCRYFVEKTSGCDAMHCRCSLVFCYQCGGTLSHTARAYVRLDHAANTPRTATAAADSATKGYTASVANRRTCAARRLLRRSPLHSV